MRSGARSTGLPIAIRPRSAIEANAEALARYAAICQSEGIVPIVEPEVLIDGDHTIERCDEVSEAVLHAVFHALHRHKRGMLEGMVLKPSMVLPGKERRQGEPRGRRRSDAPRSAPHRAGRGADHQLPVGRAEPREATANLNAMNLMAPNGAWVLSFSYARALQDPAIKTWAGRSENVSAAQKAFYRRLKMNSLARSGKYRAEMEKAA